MRACVCVRVRACLRVSVYVWEGGRLGGCGWLDVGGWVGVVEWECERVGVVGG